MNRRIRAGFLTLFIFFALNLFLLSQEQSEKVVTVEPNYVRDDIAPDCTMYNSQISVTAGEVIEFTASGSWSWDGGLNTCGPEGTAITLSGDPKHGLMGRIGNHIFFIGTQNTVVAQSSGELFLGRNDDNCDSLAQFQGNIEVIIKFVRKPLDKDGLSLNIRILILIASVILLYIMTRFLLYEFLIKRNMHPFKAKAVFISLLLLFALSVFTALFYDYIPIYIFIVLGVLWLTYFIFVLLKEGK